MEAHGSATTRPGEKFTTDEVIRALRGFTSSVNGANTTTMMEEAFDDPQGTRDALLIETGHRVDGKCLGYLTIGMAMARRIAETR